MTLCNHCKKADNGCPVYPLETTGCASLMVRDGEHKQAELIVAEGLTGLPDSPDRARRWQLLVRIISEGMSR